MNHALLAFALVSALPAAAYAQDGDADLATQLANPVSSLISLPFQNNYDCCYGPNDGFRYTLNIQPVIPASINANWNVIVRTIVPVIYQEEPIPGAEDAFGFSDVVQSFFFSPSTPAGGVTWGVGPAFLWPTGTDGLSSGKWGVGPTLVALKQNGPTTVGILANQIWSYAGAASHPNVSQALLQPFYTFTYPSSTAVTINTESTYDWERQEWTVPLNAGVSHVYKFGGQRVQLGATARVYLQRPDDGPEWGLRLNATFLFPK